MKKCKETGINFFSDYQQYWIFDDRNPKFTKKTGGYILDVKENSDFGVNYYSNLIINSFKTLTNLNEFNIVLYVPSSKANKISKGMERILNRLCDEFDTLEFNQCLRRIRNVPKKAHGGTRNKSLELETIEVINSEYIKEKNIILFDDVTTTGTSLLTCKEILQYNGANKVACIALGKTV